MPLVGLCGGVAWGGVVLVLLEVPWVIVPFVSHKLLNQIVLQPLFVQSVRELRHRCPSCRQRVFAVVSPPASELPGEVVGFAFLPRVIGVGGVGVGGGVCVVGEGCRVVHLLVVAWL